MEYRDYYSILGVDRQANADNIKRAYRKLARKYHPDVSTEKNAEEKFKELQEAYEVLKDPQKRQAYDQLGSQWKSGQEFRPPPHWQGFDFGGGAQGFSEEDIQGGGAFSDFFESIFGRAHAGCFRSHQKSHGRSRGQDEHAKITITLEEAFRGGDKTIHLQMPERETSGQLRYQDRTLKIHIPAGILPQQQLRLNQQGSPGLNGGPPGDLYLEIEIAPHKLFSLQNRDVYITLPITPWEAALGAKITVPTLGGAVDVKITPDSQTGQKLRLKGRGLSDKKVQGDQYIILQIWTPPAKTETNRLLYEKMAQEMPFNPRQHNRSWDA